MSVSENKENASGLATEWLIWCLPTLALLLIGIFGIGLIPELPSFLMILVIGLIVTRIIFLLRSRRGPGVKISLIIVWVVIFVIAGFISLFLPWKIYRCVKADAQSRFEAKISNLYPSGLYQEAFTVPFEIGTVNATEFHTFINFWVFESRAYTLLCAYNEEEYEKATALMEDRCSFRTEQLETGRLNDGHAEIKIDPYTMIGNNFFRIVLPENGNHFPFYKECFLIMKNDVERQIAYIAFSDIDLDEAENLTEFIVEYCGWKYIHS
ncbi:MAG: hypothetical protein IKH57_20600 [Clostridia bacterium]|nr:hypothetical protein [Clostridia bacterium]